MFTVNYFENTKKPIVSKTLTIEEIFSIIKSGGDNLQKIINLRKLGKSHSDFASIKETLPTVRFNFIFDRKASNDRILAPTGFIYIDVDACDSIDLSNNLIFAAWKSVSQTGYSIIVKVENLTIDNFDNTYNEISSLLNLSTDIGAKKPTQQTILSFDSNIYINNESTTFIALNKKVSNGIIQEKEERLIEPNDTFLKSDVIRFNNISDYFINSDEEYIYFEEKEKLCIPFIPNGIEEGRRNIVMYFNLSQFALLNPYAGVGVLLKIAKLINSKFYVPYTDEKITSIINAVIKQREEGKLKPYFNKERRIIFNPKYKLTAKQKIKKTNQIMGKQKTEQTKKVIYSIIENWNFANEGKITQQGVVEKSNKSIITIKRYWPEFKDYVTSLNKDFKSNNKIDSITENINNNVNEAITDTEIKETYPSITEEEKDVYTQNNEEQESIEAWFKLKNEKLKKFLTN
jgi:hypothetical protein